MQDSSNIIKFLFDEYQHAEIEAYAKLLSERNRYIAKLQHIIQTLCEENCRLSRQERILYDHQGTPVLFRRTVGGHYVQVEDLVSESDSDSDSVDTTMGDLLGFNEELSE